MYVLELTRLTSVRLLAKDDYYAILGVAKTASQGDIKTAYYKLAKEMHPDLLHNKGKEDIKQKFAQISAAYNVRAQLLFLFGSLFKVLGDAKSRDKYDKFGHQADNVSNSIWKTLTLKLAEDPNLEGFSSAFEDMFGDMNTNIDFTRGKNLELPVKLSFEEAVRGTQKKVIYTALGSCNVCSGTGARPGAKIEKCQICAGAGWVC